VTTTMHRTPFQVKAQAGRRFTGLASTWDLDYGGDVIVQGAYARTLAEWKATGRVIPLIDMHNYGSVKSVVGRLVDAEETADGLDGTFEIMAGAEGEPYSARVRDNLIDGLSIGYEVVSSREPTDSERKMGVRRVIEDLELREVSLVIWGMNPNALITNVKAQLAQLKDSPSELRKLNTFIGNLQKKAPPEESADAPEQDATTPPEATPGPPADSRKADDAAVRRAELLRDMKLRELLEGT